MNSRKREICNVHVHRASLAKHFRSKKHLENEIIIPEWLFQEPIENEFEKTYNPKPLKQVARDNIKLDDRQSIKKPAKKMLVPYYFTDRVLQVGFNITLESHHNSHVNSKIIIKPNHPEFGIEAR